MIVDSAALFIGKFPTDTGVEYRVAHAEGVDQCDAMFPANIADLYRVLYYGSSKRYLTEEAARVFADDVAERYWQYVDQERGTYLVEYARPFAKLSPQEAGNSLDEYFMSQEFCG